MSLETYNNLTLVQKAALIHQWNEEQKAAEKEAKKANRGRR